MSKRGSLPFGHEPSANHIPSFAPREFRAPDRSHSRIKCQRNFPIRLLPIAAMPLAFSHNPQDEPAIMSRCLRNYFVLKDFQKYTRSSVAVAHIRLSLANSCYGETTRSSSARSSLEILGLPSRCSAPFPHRTRKSITNLLLTQRQFVLEVLNPIKHPMSRRSSSSISESPLSTRPTRLASSPLASGHSLVAEGAPIYD
ncbi:hypothetical protein C8F01DRAFT_1230296, partial [Mycena amicta]